MEIQATNKYIMAIFSLAGYVPGEKDKYLTARQAGKPGRRVVPFLQYCMVHSDKRVLFFYSVATLSLTFLFFLLRRHNINKDNDSHQSSPVMGGLYVRVEILRFARVHLHFPAESIATL